MKKLVLILTASLTLIVLLSGCGHTHTWTEATCTEPKTCPEDGATEGEPLGHDWRPATCTEPKTCARCGETEGEPLGHDWKDATCTEPLTCSRCGATEGEALGHTPLDADYWTPSLCAVCGEELGPVIPPDFEAKYGLSVNMEVGETYDFVTHCYDDATKTTTAHVTITKAGTYPELTDYACGDGSVWNFEGKEGYEWRTVSMDALFDDDNAWNYGTAYTFLYGSYYEIRDPSESENDTENEWTETEYGYVLIYEETYKGETYDDCRMVVKYEWSDWDRDARSVHCNIDAAWLVPVGYDGCIIGPWDTTLEAPEGQGLYDIADDNCLFYRLV